MQHLYTILWCWIQVILVLLYGFNACFTCFPAHRKTISVVWSCLTISVKHDHTLNTQLEWTNRPCSFTLTSLSERYKSASLWLPPPPGQLPYVVSHHAPPLPQDLVKSHLMYAVREEVEVLKEQIKELYERNSVLERENAVLKSLANSEQLSQLSAQSNTGSGATPPQQGLSQPQQQAQPPPQPQPQPQSHPQLQHHPKPQQLQTQPQLDPGQQQQQQPNVTSAWSASAPLCMGREKKEEHLRYNLLQLVYVKLKRRKKKLCLLSHQLDHKVQCLCVCVCACVRKCDCEM